MIIWPPPAFDLYSDRALQEIVSLLVTCPTLWTISGAERNMANLHSKVPGVYF